MSSPAPEQAGVAPLLTAEDVAEVLQCTPSWVKELARRREVPFCLIGGQYRFTADHVAAIIELTEQLPEEPYQPSPVRRRQDPPAQDVPRLRARRPRRRGS